MAVNDIANSQSVGRDASHEIGHQGGVPDYYTYLKENPFTNRVANVTVKSKDGLTSYYSVGELMDNQGVLRVLSLESIKRMVTIPINTANNPKNPENKIILLSGSVNQPIDATQPSSNNPSKVLKKEN